MTVSFPKQSALGALAGFTIYLGLPAGRLQLLGSRGRVALAMFSVGILAFIFVDVLSSGLGIVHNALDQVKNHHGSVAYLIWLVVLLGVGFLAGSSGLAAIERRMRPVGPRTAADRRRLERRDGRTSPRPTRSPTSWTWRGAGRSARG